MFELQILAANVLLPTGIMAATLLVVHCSTAGRISRPVSIESAPISGTTSASSTAEKLAWAAVALAGAGAIWLAFGLRAEAVRSIWPEDAWARIPLAIGIASLGGILAQWVEWPILAWTVRAACLLVAAKSIIPTGESWESLEASANVWIAVLALSSLGGWWLLDRRDHRDAGALGLGWLMCIAAAAFLSQDFLRVTEPMLAMASVLGCASLAALIVRRKQYVTLVSGPCLFGCGAAVASAQFNSFLGLPDSLSWLAIASPAMAAVLSAPFALTRQPGEAPSKRNLVLVILICLILAAIVVSWTLIAKGLGGTDDWA